ncbi:MAG: glycosyltransferase family 4 protein [Tepidisphaeraceae bacterium]
MRIAFLTFEYPDVRPGGVGSYTLKCAAAIARAGHEPHIFTTTVPAAARNALPQGVFLHQVPDVAERLAAGALPPPLAAAALGCTQAAYKLGIGALLCDALRTEHQADRFDLVEAAECEALALPLLLRPIRNLPVVVQIHLGYAANAFGNSAAATDHDVLAEALELASIVGADAVCAATASVVEVTRKLCPFDRQATIISHPVDVSPDRTPTPAPSGGPALFVGRLLRRKGCDVLAAAANIFLRREPRATLRIAGSDSPVASGGPSMLAEMIAAGDAPLRDRFIYLGELSQAQVRREIEACSFQVVPSTVENFANTAVDAMAQGRLVIYGGNTGLDEVVGDAGLRVWPLTAENLAQKMQEAWTNPQLVQEYGQRGFNRVCTNFNEAKITQDRLTFYGKVISEHRRDPAPPPRQWQALNSLQIRSILEALVQQMSGTLGLPGAILTPGRLLTARLKELENRRQRPPKVWLFGAGRFTTRLLGERHLWESIGLPLAGIVDEHPRFQQNPTYLGLEVQTPAQLCAAIEHGQVVDAIILSTDTLHEVLRRRAECFRELGVEVLAL